MSYINLTERQRLERVYQLEGDIQSRPSKVRETLQSVAIALLNFFTQNRNEPQVHVRFNAAGEPIWHIYDPHTEQTTLCFSEPDVRAWLESRYHSM
jgi:hypothetical protein